MTFTVGVYRGAEGFVWVVRGDTDEILKDGQEADWTDALSQAVMTMAIALGREYGAPAMRVHGLERD